LWEASYVPDTQFNETSAIVITEGIEHERRG
jgi:hypothetical protein